MKRKKKIRLALDIDGVLCDFVGGVIKRAKELDIEFLKSREEWVCWDGHDNFSKVMKAAWLDEDFWLNLKPLNTLPVTPHMYITSRPIDTKITEKWLSMHGFPKAKVITVSKPEEKIQHLINEKINVLVDDLHTTVKASLDAGVPAFLFVQHHQAGHTDDCEHLPKLEKLEDLETLCS